MKLLCKFCGAEFDAKKKNAKYCCTNHRVQDSEKRKKSGEKGEVLQSWPEVVSELQTDIGSDWLKRLKEIMASSPVASQFNSVVSQFAESKLGPPPDGPAELTTVGGETVWVTLPEQPPVFGNENIFFIEKYTKYPKAHEPVSPILKAGWLRQKRKSDAEIKAAWEAARNKK